MKIYAFHLLNDYSGSPKVLMQLVKGWTRHGHDVHVVTCSGRRGFLSDLPGVTHHTYWYRWAAHPLLRLVNFTASQLVLFLTFLITVKKDDIVYINTVFPFGAALLGKLKGCRVIYHVHETSVAPAALKKLLFGILRLTASDVVYVSSYLAEQEPISRIKTHLLYNAIEDDFLQTARSFTRVTLMPQNVLMVCSLKIYKGVYEFARLANMNNDLNFQLVVNASQHDINQFCQDADLPANLQIFAVQTNLHPFYQWADIIVNLSLPDRWIETFGLTILEGMAYGLPAIVPPIGGITELVSNSVNGYHADARDLKTLTEKLRALCAPELYEKMQRNALAAINLFSEDHFITGSLNILNVRQVECVSTPWNAHSLPY
jgi:L-malate glycosyltransferase